MAKAHVVNRQGMVRFRAAKNENGGAIRIAPPFWSLEEANQPYWQARHSS